MKSILCALKKNKKQKNNGLHVCFWFGKKESNVERDFFKDVQGI